MYARHVIVAAVLSTGPNTPASDVTRAYTYHVPDGNLAEDVDAALSARIAEPNCFSPALLVRSAMSDDAPYNNLICAPNADAPVVVILILLATESTGTVVKVYVNVVGIV